MERELTFPAERLPRHIAIIMDGNGRWARQRQLPRMRGHERGGESVRKVLTECGRLHKRYGNPTHMTLYSFSTENWKRPAEEVQFLMSMYVQYMHKELPTLMENNVRFRQIGRLDGLPEEVLTAMHETTDRTAGNTGLTLTLAVNYGSRAEITDAVRDIAQRVREGKLSPDDITEQTITDSLYTAGQPDPDILIRTAGEMRISNYLLWQISYAELYVTDTLWPDFDEDQLHKALQSYATRHRRFGGL